MKYILILLFVAISIGTNAQNREHAFEVNNRLGRGINFGNMFEAPSESEWGNPWKPEYSGMLKNLGFNHVRIPIRWEPAARSLSVEPYTVNPNFLKRIKLVVDSALNNNLHAIINMHHHEALYENPDGQKARFLAQWEQISEYFKDYPDSLLFEVMNEPHGNLTPAKWNVLFADALTTIRETNPARVVLMGTADYGGLGGLSKLKLPEDDNIIVTVHYYNPFSFTHQGAEWVGDDADAWLGTKWEDTEIDRSIVEKDFAPLKQFEISNNIPIHIGEFGAYSKADDISREKWTTCLSRFFETKGWSWAYWEFSAGFGIYDKGKKQCIDYLVDALLHNEMPEPTEFVSETIFESKFENSNDGWNFQKFSGSASMVRSDNALNVTVTNGGTEGWHLQLVKNNIQLEAGKKYILSYKAKSDANRSITTYVGINKDPWSWYSGGGVSVSDTFTVYYLVFEMQVNDNSARIVFDVGNSNNDFSVTDVKLAEILTGNTTATQTFENFDTQVYPNPVNSKVFINNLDNFKSFSILNMQGATVKSERLNKNLNQIDIGNMPPGFYLIHLVGNDKSISKKILKR